ncbi:ATP-binding protein [Streptomyces sp. KM273126]|uniref:ATP-binding protein n=1 Tax=Streptomyces sp. KM273126 TaxID=2545247 RepID=UPI0037DA21E0
MPPATPQRPPSPHIARHTIRTALLGHGRPHELTDTAELLTSELVSNAVKHSDGPVTIRLHSHPDAVRIGVMDNHPELPDPSPAPPTRTSAAASTWWKPWPTHGAATRSPPTPEHPAGRSCGSNCPPQQRPSPRPRPQVWCTSRSATLPADVLHLRTSLPTESRRTPCPWTQPLLGVSADSDQVARPASRQRSKEVASSAPRRRPCNP